MLRSIINRSPDPQQWDVGATFATVEDAVKAVSGLGGHNVRTPDQDKVFLENATEKAVSEAAKAERRVFLDGFDNKFKELTGVQRDPNVKTTDYVTKAYTDLKEKLSGVTGEFDKFKDSKLSESQAAQEVKAQLDKFKATAKGELDTANNTIAEMKTNQFKYRVDGSVQEAMSRIRPLLKKNEFLEDAIEARIRKFDTDFNPVDHEGTIIYHNANDNSPAIDSTNGNHLSTHSLLTKIFEPIFETGRSQTGTGAAGGSESGVNLGADAYKLSLPEGINTRMGLMDYLQSGKVMVEGKVVENGSQLFNKLFEINSVGKDGKMLPLR